MARYRNALPQLGGALFLTDAGIETTLIFRERLDLPDFAAFDLLNRPDGRDALLRYFRTYADLAKRFRAGLVLESATWRASADWGERLGYGRGALADVNRAAIELLEEIRADVAGSVVTVISGCIGPRADGYVPGRRMSEPQAQAYHAAQVGTFALTAADMVTAISMSYAEEAIGVARAAQDAALPAAISFTVETDGRLPTGQTLQEAIEAVDEATGGYPAYYMINCAHPAHFAHALDGDEGWIGRIRGLRANASRKSHAELDGSRTLDTGNPAELGLQYAGLKRRLLPALNVIGGCCGTDHRHIEQMAAHCAPLFARAA